MSSSPRPRTPSRTSRILALVLGLRAASGVCAEPPPLNEKVVGYARERLGKKVGDGSCYTLAVEALERAGARSTPLGRAGGDYVWGRRVESVKDALPGDILQFRDAEFKGKQRFPKGRWISWYHSYPHHTAILSGVRDGGKTITVLHQNVGPEGADDARKKVVQEGTLRIDSLQKGGWVRIYRPIPPVGAREWPDSPGSE